MARAKKAAPVPTVINLSALQQALLDSAQHLRECKEERDAALMAHQEAFKQYVDLQRQLQDGLNQLATAAHVHDLAEE